MIARLAPTAIVLASLLVAPAGAHEPNAREHPDPATAARAAERAALAQRLSKQKLIILDSGVLGCANGDIVIFDGARNSFRAIAPGIVVVPTRCR